MANMPRLWILETNEIVNRLNRKKSASLSTCPSLWPQIMCTQISAVILMIILSISNCKNLFSEVKGQIGRFSWSQMGFTKIKIRNVKLGWTWQLIFKSWLIINSSSIRNAIKILAILGKYNAIPKFKVLHLKIGRPRVEFCCSCLVVFQTLSKHS